MNSNDIVLVISDGQEQFGDAASRLRTNGYSVRFATDMGQGIEVARAKRPQLIISELAVPDIDGLRLCKHVRGLDVLESTPILLVGDIPGNTSIVADAIRCGATSYLQKPFGDKELFDVCQRMLNNEDEGPGRSRADSIPDTRVENTANAITIMDSEGQIYLRVRPQRKFWGTHRLN